MDHDRIMDDYFDSIDTVYDEGDFRQHFQMSKNLFFHLVNDISAHNSYFVQKRNASSKLGLSNIQKYLVAIQILGYGITPNAMDQYVHISE